ncbi:transporter - putative [Leishmania donovani]|uniref:Transporter_-_putative n=3 Tax=Leishmania donovani species complex TaxID=38574 RepID=A0A6L0XJ76_LEIIN|nr:putative transporter [Leishmania infantum JPCM5]XP_003860254.1 transporter, putative [Leishmania donovani]CAC9482886.1 transporter_-_putative [Leishmania infantum]AYU78174.1 transporter, putative [Leishmania donovani]TPP41804.1 Membrane transport family protein [Leishmania donovani]TPP50991.1 Membrane transport family protein [Leishmania donovani]CAJ1988191.1 transporter - putative [Leishmania donovani]|eukprot:XP_001465037.1 putative transporter [Leishmania infantum JPCM5]
MGDLYLGMMLITATTVGKIILCALAGMLVSRYFSNPKETLTGLSYISARVFLPCLLFANLSMNVTWEQLSKFYWAPLFALLPMGIGFLSSMLVRAVLRREYHFVVILASSFQNGLTFPVSVLLNLKGIEWFTGAAVVDAQSYIFLYNVVCSIGLWALGDPMIAYAKTKEVESEEANDEELVARRRPYSMDGRVDGEAEGKEKAQSSPHTAAAAQQGHATAHEQLEWYRPAQASDKPIMLPPGSPGILLDDEMRITNSKLKPRDDRLKRLGRIALTSIQSPTVLSSIIALIISLTPPLQRLAKSPFGEPFVGGMALVGKGAIPLHLVVLGSSVAASRPKAHPTSSAKRAQVTISSPTTSAPLPTSADGTVFDVSASQPGTGVNALRYWITSRVQPQILFTCCAVVTRLVIIPCICFLALHILVKAGLMPSEKPFLLSMLVAIISPTAINSTLICTMREYHVRDYSHMMFFMYLSSIITSSVWLFCILLYLSD